MRVDPLVPRAAKLDAIDGDKLRVNSASLDSPLVVLANQTLKVLALDKRLHVSTPGLFQCWLRAVNEVSVCDGSHVTCHAARLASRRTTRAAHFTPLSQFPGALLIFLAAPLWTGQDVIGSPRSFPRPGWSRRPVRKLMQETWEWRNGHWWTPFGQ